MNLVDYIESTNRLYTCLDGFDDVILNGYDISGIGTMRIRYNSETGAYELYCFFTNKPMQPDQINMAVFNIVQALQYQIFKHGQLLSCLVDKLPVIYSKEYMEVCITDLTEDEIVPAILFMQSGYNTYHYDLKFEYNSGLIC